MMALTHEGAVRLFPQGRKWVHLHGRLLLCDKAIRARNSRYTVLEEIYPEIINT